MSSTQEFRRRIKSVNNTKQITKAMEMIASIKMQKAVKIIAASRAYIHEAWNVLSKLAKQVLPADHLLIAKREVKKTAVILITSDRGLCGSCNSEIIKKLLNFSQENNVLPADLDVIAVGKIGAGYVNRYKVANLVAEFKAFENNILADDIIPIAKLTSDEFVNGKYDRVVLIYSHFESSIKQIPVAQQILPIIDSPLDIEDVWTKQEQTESEYKFEPSADIVLSTVLTQIIRTQIFGAVLEANASEHSARMVAMKNATDNAKELIDELTLLYNSVRQNNITSEIAEISGAAEAMK